MKQFYYVQVSPLSDGAPTPNRRHRADNKRVRYSITTGFTITGLRYSFFKEHILVLTRGLHTKCGRRHLMACLFRMFGILCHVMLMNSCDVTYILQITTSRNHEAVRGMIRCSKLVIHWISSARDCAKYGQRVNMLQLMNQ